MLVCLSYASPCSVYFFMYKMTVVTMTFNFNHETQKTKKWNLNEYKKKGEIENIGGKLGGKEKPCIFL